MYSAWETKWNGNSQREPARGIQSEVYPERSVESMPKHPLLCVNDRYPQFDSPPANVWTLPSYQFSSELLLYAQDQFLIIFSPTHAQDKFWTLNIFQPLPSSGSKLFPPTCLVLSSYLLNRNSFWSSSLLPMQDKFWTLNIFPPLPRFWTLPSFLT